MSSRSRDQSELESLAVVALLKDLPEHGLVRGQVGTVVELLTPSVAEVEFSDEQGRTYAMVALGAEEILRLHHRPSELVA
jgi:hypothetical protein